MPHLVFLDAIIVSIAAFDSFFLAGRRRDHFLLFAIAKVEGTSRETPDSSAAPGT